MLHHAPASRVTYVIIYVMLIALTAATTGIAFLDLGKFNAVLAIMIAVMKATLVALFFMHLRESLRLTWVMRSVGLVWLAILIVTTVADLLTRGWLGVPGS